MKKILYIIWVAVVLMIGLLFIQNQSLYLTKQILSLNMLLFDITLPPISNGIILLIFFFGGILLSAASSLISRFKTRKSLLQYFTCARQGLKSDGMFFIDVYGGTEAQVELHHRSSRQTGL